MRHTIDYAKELRNTIDYQRFYKLLKTIGTDLNSRKNRFDKGSIIEQALSIYSNNQLVWKDEIGRDLYDSKYKYDIEVKFSENLLFTLKNRKRKNTKIKIKNSLGKNKGTTIHNPADFYILAQQNALAIIDWKTMKPYLRSVPDGIEATIPTDVLMFIFTPDDVNNINTVECVKCSYSQIKAKAQQDLIKSIPPTK